MPKNGVLLLIDDDKDDCELIKAALEQEKITNELICFANGKEAIDYLKQTNIKPLVILSDINIPVMGGLEIRKRIDEDKALKM